MRLTRPFIIMGNVARNEGWGLYTRLAFQKQAGAFLASARKSRPVFGPLQILWPVRGHTFFASPGKAGITHYTLLRKVVCQRGAPFGNPEHYFGPKWPEVVSIHKAATTVLCCGLVCCKSSGCRLSDLQDFGENRSRSFHQKVCGTA